MIIPVPVHPWPLPPEREALIRAAKKSLETDVQIRLTEWNPGDPGRVLSFAGRPPHIARWAPIRPENRENVASIAAALKFIIDEATSAESRTWNYESWLSDVMQCDVKFVGEEELVSGVKFA